LGEDAGPLLSAGGHGIGQADPLPGQQAVGGEAGEERDVEDPVGGLSHQEAATQEVEVVQGGQEPCRERRARVKRRGRDMGRKSTDFFVKLARYTVHLIQSQ